MNVPLQKRLFKFGLLLALVALGVTAGIALAADPPGGISFTLQGCNLPDSNHDGIPDYTLPLNGLFVCKNQTWTGANDDYTTGNLGKSWNELDLVPYRVVVDAGNSAPATASFTFAIALDYEDGGKPGYDVISIPVKNPASAASCPDPVVSDSMISTPGLGGISKSIYRLVTLNNVAKNTTCIYDYYGRLALGAHLFPGSSLHGNLALPVASPKVGEATITTSGMGSRDISIPVNEISPQELRKDMSATQGSDHAWNIFKGATPVSLNFGNTCDTTKSLTAPVAVTVTWEKLAASPSGPVTIITHVYAKNPASRPIVVNVTDKIYSGTDQTNLLDTDSITGVAVAANTELLVLTHTFEWTNPTAGVTALNDVATATYTDEATGIPVPGNTTASASATIQNTGLELNASAIINDLESITGAGLSYSTDSSTGAAGTFDNSYVPGTKTTGGVSWTSDTQNGNASVTFAKTIYVAKGAIVPDGNLHDIATLTGSNDFTASATADVAISADTKAELTITKTIPDILQNGETVTFNFTVKDAGGVTAATPSITFAAGETSKSVKVGDLTPGVYTVYETTAAGFDAQNPISVDLRASICTGGATFTNTAVPASAKVRKVTVPAGSEAGWVFDLKQGTTVLETVTTGDANYIAFTTKLGEGSYLIVEHTQTGWTSGGGSAECAFTVNLPADAGKAFACTYTNTANPASAKVKKITVPDGYEAGWTFMLKDSGNNTLETVTTTGADFIAFQIQLYTGSYSIVEVSQSGWTSDGGVGCSFTVSLPADREKVFECTFTNTANPASAKVRKVTVPAGSEAGWVFDLKQGTTVLETVTTTNASFITFTKKLGAGSYAIVEHTQTGWTSDGGSAECAFTVTLPADRDWVFACTYTNTANPASAKVKKVTVPAGFEPGWTFALKQGATVLETVTTTGTGFIPFTKELYSGTYAIVETSQPGWTSAGSAGCTFTVTLPADREKVFECTFTNTYQPSVQLTKTGDPLGKVGDPVHYTLELENTGSTGGAAGAPGLTCTVSDPTIGFSQTVTLAAGASQTWHPTFTIPVGASDPFVNKATATCTYVGGTAVMASDNASHTTELFQPSVKVTKTGPDYSKVGDTVTYTVKIENTSSTDSPALVLASFSDSKVSGVTPPAACSPLASGASCQFTYPYTVVASDDSGKTGAVLSNTATAHYNPTGFPNDVTSSSKWDLTLLHPSFSVSKSCDVQPVPQAGPANFTVTLTNTGDAILEITASDSIGKVTLGPGASQTFPVSVSGPFAGQASVANEVTASAVLDARYALSNQLGPITAQATCSVGGLVNVKKLTQGVVDSGKDWQFGLFTGPHATDPATGWLGAPLATGSSLGKADGIIAFTTTLDSAKTYTICEMNGMVGWDAVWTIGVNGAAITPYNPDGAQTPSYPNGQDLGRRCFDFGAGTAYAVPAGGTVEFQVDNRYPEGQTRTIGYWKNWSSCTGGKQFENAQKNGGTEAGFWTIDDVLNKPGITLGGFTIPAALAEHTFTVGGVTYTKTGCEIAVALLGKRNAATGTNMANDGLYAMAAQLIAAKANLVAGAKGQSGILDVIQAADALLLKYNFDGTGSYLGPKVKGALLTDRNKAFALADQLDKYNNGFPGPFVASTVRPPVFPDDAGMAQVYLPMVGLRR